MRIIIYYYYFYYFDLLINKKQKLNYFYWFNLKLLSFNKTKMPRHNNAITYVHLRKHW